MSIEPSRSNPVPGAGAPPRSQGDLACRPRQRYTRTFFASAAAVVVMVLATVVIRIWVPAEDPKVSKTLSDFARDLRTAQPWYITAAYRTRIIRFLPPKWVTWLRKEELAHTSRRNQAVWALRKEGTNAWPVIPELVSTMTHRNLEVRFMAVQALFEIRAVEHPDWSTFSQALRGSDRAAEVLRYFQGTTVQYLGSNPAEARAFMLIGLAACGPAAKLAYADLMEQLRFGNEPRMRALAVTALAEVQTQRSNTVPLFKQILTDKREWGEVSASAAEALVVAARNDREVRELLREALKDDRSLVRVEAARALWQLKEPVDRVLPSLAEMLGHKLPSVRNQTLKVVAEMGSEAAPLRSDVERMVKDPNLKVQAAAEAALQRLGK